MFFYLSQENSGHVADRMYRLDRKRFIRPVSKCRRKLCTNYRHAVAQSLALSRTLGVVKKLFGSFLHRFVLIVLHVLLCSYKASQLVKRTQTDLPVIYKLGLKSCTRYQQVFGRYTACDTNAVHALRATFHTFFKLKSPNFKKFHGRKTALRDSGRDVTVVISIIEFRAAAAVSAANGASSIYGSV